VSSRFVKASAVAIVTLLAGVAVASDDAWSSLDDALKARGTSNAMLVLVAKPDANEVNDIGKMISDKKLLKSGQITAVRVEPGDGDWAKKFNLTVKNERLLVLDGYGSLVEKEDRVPSESKLATAMKHAADATAKKKKIEKKLDGVVAKAEAAMKKDDTKSACEQLAAVLEYETQLPCPAIEKARQLIDQLSDKGKAKLEEARAAIGKNELPKARKIVNDTTTAYPTPAVLEEAKKVKDELATAERRASGK
jgi:hypothetical protein